MKMPSYKTIIPVAIAALAYLTPDSAYAQARQPQRQTLHNRILSRNQEYSATGEGVLLKDFVYNFTLGHDSRINLDDTFGLYAERGGSVSYGVVGLRKGLADVVSFLKKDLPVTDEDKASIRYIEGLRNTKDSDMASVGLLERALKDGVLDFEADSLNRVKEGKYVFVAKSKKVGGYNSNSIPIIVDVKIASPETRSDTSSEKQPQKRYETYNIIPSVTAHARDSLERARRASLARKLAREDFVRDSTANARRQQFVKDSLSREKFKANMKKYSEEEKELETRFGIEYGVGTNKEAVFGAFVDVPQNLGVSVEGYGDFYLVRGNPIYSNSRTEVTERDRQLIGPEISPGMGSGTYKQRTDEITTNTERRALAEVGLRALFKANRNFEIPLGLGINLSKEREELVGKSTIEFERNMQPLGEPQVITNSKDGGRRKVANLALSAGAFYTLYDCLSAGVSLNRTGKDNSVRLNVKYRF